MFSPMARAAVSTSLSCVSIIAASAGLTSTPIRATPGTRSRRSSNRFAATSALKTLIPVMLLLGRERLAARPSRTGSSATRNVIGIVAVAAWAAKVAVGPPVAITATLRRTRSAASSGKRSA
jgi:hypothetical protein